MSASSLSSPSPLSDFIPLSRTVSLYTPPTIMTSFKSHPNAPTLIIMCTWAGGATASRIAKYTTPYRRLLPTVPILLIQTHPMPVALMPFPIPTGHIFTEAVASICSHLKSVPEGKASVHMHIFSHGGCNSALNLIHKLHVEGIKMPFGSVAFDSCPSKLDFWASWRALRVSLPDATIPRAVLGGVVMQALGQVAVMQRVGILRDGNRISKELNDRKTFGSAKRAYLLGENDEVLDWREAWRHGEDAKRMGVDVAVALFEAEHCALVVGKDGENERRYWRAVTSLWENGRDSKL